MKHIVLPETIIRHIPQELLDFFRETEEGVYHFFFWLYFFSDDLRDANDRIMMTMSEVDWASHDYPDDPTVPDFNLQVARLTSIYIDFTRHIDPYLYWIRDLDEETALVDFSIQRYPDTVVLATTFGRINNRCYQSILTDTQRSVGIG